jgi:hypothetical protein
MLLNFLYSSDSILSFIATNGSLIESICSAALTRINLDQASKSYIQETYSTARQQKTASNRAAHNDTTKTPVKLGSQISEEDISMIDHLFHKYFLCLQTVSTCELGVLALNQSAAHVIKLIDGYLERVLANLDAWEIKSTQMSKLDIGDESIQNVTCIMSVMSSIMPGREETDDLIEMQDRNDHFFVRLLTFCFYYLNFVTERKRMPREEEAEATASYDDFASELEQLNDAKNAIEEFLVIAYRMKTENNVVLNKLIDDCVNLAKDY